MKTDRHTITLIGHSGCKLQVRRLYGTLVAVKTSKDAGYNDRLRLQAEKQKSYTHAKFKAPKIYRECINKDGLCEFHMEYIPGKTLATHLHSLPLVSIKDIAEQLLDIVQVDAATNSKVNTIFRTKIRSLRSALPQKMEPAVKKALAHLRSVDWTHCEESACHGDLTLENIIMRDKDVYLIDFLDSFYSSWMMDVATLLQDIECLWSYRHEPISDNLQVRLLALKNSLISKIRSRHNGEEQLVLIYNLLLLKLLRILPYTNDAATLEYLYREIDRLTNKIIARQI